MIRFVIIFIVTFALGAVAAVVVRTSAHQPYVDAVTEPVSAMPEMHHDDHDAPMVMQGTTVNTVCAICGMPVNAALGSALYHEQRVGFGCKICPAQFAANPEKYGPSALKNVIAE